MANMLINLSTEAQNERQIVRRSYKFKIYPTNAQRESLESTLCECCRLYNAAIQERIEAWQLQRKPISWYDQKKQVKDIRAAGDIGIANFDVAANVLKRVDLAFQAFFQRCKTGGAPGFPRYHTSARYDSFTFSTWRNGCRFIGSRLYAQGIGNLKIRLHRPIEGRIKTLTIKREAGQWFAIFSCEVEVEPLPPCDKSVGIDLGLKSFIATSDGETVKNPHFFKQTEIALRVANRKLARREKGSLGWNEAKAEVQKLHAKIKNQRREFHHALSRRIVNENGLIAIEDLKVAEMAKDFFAKLTYDAAWSTFTFQLAYKAKSAGRSLVKIDPSGTSDVCICGNPVPKKLSQRKHFCETCGAKEDRDIMSAKVILHRALTEQR